MNYIDGKWREAESGQRIESRSPADVSQVIGTVARSGIDDVALAVQAAQAAFPAWSQTSRIVRGEYLDRVAQLVKREAGKLAQLIARESGKPINEAMADVVEGLHMLQYQFGLSRIPAGEIVASEIPDKDAFIFRRPRGVVAAITPWNFPFAIPLWLIGPSLLEGNTVVLKPSEETPVVAQRLVEMFHESGLPPGVLNLVQGTGEEAGATLVRHPHVNVVLFTGSYEVGMDILNACSYPPHKLAVCEMGGKNGIIVCDDANLDVAVHASILSAFKTAGQRCTSASRLIVHERILDEFERRFVEQTRRIVIGDPLRSTTFMGPLINKHAVWRVEQYNELAVREGANVLMQADRLADGEFAYGCYLTPFVYRMRHSSKATVLQEEVFGPHVAIIPFSDLDEAIAIYNDTPYGLALAVFTGSYRTARRVREACQYGVGYWNLPTIGAEVHLPFGGVKRSGTGIPSAAGLIHAVTRTVTWTTGSGIDIIMAQGLRAEVDLGEE